MVEPTSRRTSARIKAEPGLKRRFSDALEGNATPSKPTKAAKTTAKSHKKKPPPPQPDQEPTGPVLPTKITDITPLPVLTEPQPEDLKDTEWQNTADSGVFTAALVRARQAITHGTYLERFWSKPVAVKKQKDMTEEEKIQFKIAKGPTMTKFGDATLISEPLSLKIQLLMVKDPNPGQKFGQLPPDKYHLIHGTSPHRTMPPSQNAPYRPPVQYQSPAPLRPPPQITPSPAVGISHGQAMGATPTSYGQNKGTATTSYPQNTGTVSISHPQVPISGSTLQPQAAVPSPRPQVVVPPQTSNVAPPPPPPKPATPSRAPPPAGPQAPDPVIHALAQRASANEELKAVMRIVATGKATPNQLQYFQRHIDELTEMVKLRQTQEARARAPPPPPPQAVLPQQAPRTLTPQVTNQVQQGVHSMTPPPAPAPIYRQSTTPYYQQHTPAPRPPKLMTTAAPLHVLIQFNENPNERFLFPKYGILEFIDGFTGVICSFIVLKKKDDKEYWTPVTITINEFAGDEKDRVRALTLLGRVVEPAHVVRAYMEDIMEKHERAEEGFLALRLPREKLAVDTLMT